MRVMVLLNEAAGTLASSQTCDEPQRIRDGFAAAGVDVDVRSVPGARLAETARRATEQGAGYFDAVVAGGGDGTLNTIANVLSGSRTAFGVLPLGTHNHFAKELGLPLDLDAAVAALASGRVEEWDVAEVNGRVFLNFSALGLHPRVVREREVQQEAIGEAIGKGWLGRFARVGKIFLLFVALFRVLFRMPVMRVRLRAPGGVDLRRLTPSVILCNNEHQMKIFGLEEVSHPDRGVLNVYLARATRWYGLVGLFVRALFRRLPGARNLEVLSVPEVTIETRARRGRARVSIDGEVVEMPTPLRYKVRRGGLKVIVPGGNAGGNAE